MYRFHHEGDKNRDLGTTLTETDNGITLQLDNADVPRSEMVVTLMM
jgi:hypothetical protein